MKTLDNLTEKQILALKISELKPALSPSHKLALRELNSRLKQHSVKWRPHTWFADEWFSPDGVAGFAIPFMLTHKKLIKLERKYLGYCEGDSPREFFKLCAHEAGHAIDNAYGLRLNKTRQKLFGLSSKEYPNSYRPNPNSKNYIEFLEDHYAQAHPDEDWAETFGYLLVNQNLAPRYLGTKVEEKFNLVKSIISNLSDRPFKQNIELTSNSYQNDNRTIEQYLVEKRKSLKLHRQNFYEMKLTTKFVAKKQGVPVASFMSRQRKSILNSIANTTHHDAWTIKKCFDELAKECKNKQYSFKTADQVKVEAIHSILTKNIDEYVRRGRTRIYM